MNVELIRIRNNRGESIQVDGDIKRITSKNLLDRIYSLNTCVDALSDVCNNPSAVIDDFASGMARIISIILDMFDEMGIYPDYFYDIYASVNDEYRSMQSKGMVSGGKSIHDILSFRAKISSLMENGVKVGNYKLNPTKVKNINDYYNEMIEFSKKHHLPHEITTIKMCRDAFSSVKTEFGSWINSIGISPFLSDDIENLVVLLYESINFFAIIGVNPREYLDKELERLDEKRNSK